MDDIERAKKIIEEERYQLSPKGVDTAKQVVEFFEQGYTIEQIAEWFFPDDEDNVMMLRILIAMVNESDTLN